VHCESIAHGMVTCIEKPCPGPVGSDFQLMILIAAKEEVPESARATADMYRNKSGWRLSDLNNNRHISKTTTQR
jgi:hypothetical protein